jgi:hypothetical protein
MPDHSPRASVANWSAPDGRLLCAKLSAATEIGHSHHYVRIEILFSPFANEL